MSKVQYDSDKPFNIGGITFEVKKTSASGDRIVLRTPDHPVPPKAVLKRGTAAPDFTVEDMEGNELRLSDFRGKYVLLDFWATWCGPCVEEVPRLKALYGKFSRENLVIIGINSDSDRNAVAGFVKNRGITWPQVLDRVDHKEKLVSLYNIPGYPTYFLIDRNGKLMMSRRAFRLLLSIFSPLL